MENSAFRLWCQRMWYEHCAEVEGWTGCSPAYLSGEYFNTYKWWLKREFLAVAKKQQSRG